MTNKEKEIQDTYIKWAEKALKESKDMTVEEEKRYIKENEPKMKTEIQEIIKKYSRH